MGTPVPSKTREQEYSEKITEPEVVTRQLTEEERRYYDSLAKPKKKAVLISPEDESLYNERCDLDLKKGNKIDPPEKQVLIEKLAEVEGSKTKAMKHAAEAFAVSMTTMYVWTKELNIEFGEDGKVIMPKAEQLNSGSVEPDKDTSEFDGVIKDKFGRFDYISEETNSETAEEFQLTNKMYRFSTLDIDVQYGNKRVVIVDAETGAEIEIPFAKVKAFAGNMKAIGDELEGGKA